MEDKDINEVEKETPDKEAQTDTKENIKEEVKDNLQAEKEEDKKSKKNKYKERIEELETELKNSKNKYLMNLAELENFKKRMNEEKIRDRKYASMNLIGDLLTPLDNFSRVCQMETEDATLKNFLIGFKMIDTQIFDCLTNDGLSKIEALGKPFDPTIHQAIDKEHQEGVEPGIVIAEMQTGYMYKDRVLKPAMVKVSE